MSIEMGGLRANMTTGWPSVADNAQEKQVWGQTRLSPLLSNLAARLPRNLRKQGMEVGT